MSTSTDGASGGGLHFFSLPHWTRRILPVSSSARKSLAGVSHADRHSATLPAAASPRRVLLDKDLPPIPSPQTTSRETDARLSTSGRPLQPTFFLDVYHNTPMIPSPSQVNSVAFASLPNNTAENVLRKTKSAHSLLPQDSSPSIEKPERSRGISMTQSFVTAKQASASPSVPNSNSPSSPLVRKSSFWSRKFSTQSPQYTHTTTDSPSLSEFKSTPPLPERHAGNSASLSRSHSISSAAMLSRRHSERTTRRPTTATNIPSLPASPTSPNRLNSRPSTADPYLHASPRSPSRRPATANSETSLRSRSRSLFTISHQLTPSPSNNESSSANPIPHHKTGPVNSRPRSSTNPPLLHRLSINLFAASPSSPAKSGPAFSNAVTSSPSSRSPRASLSQIPPSVLKPRENETPEAFVGRLTSIVSKADIAMVLASTGDNFYSDSLRLFIERFGFHGEPLDVALRRLLMDVCLPRETQQIDRVIEVFANRYLSCNPDLFTSRDHPYILAFSLIMLHTDAFNKSNKRKMSKADYVKNTALPGLIPEVLECFYDNTVFAPFIFIEDPLDPEGSTEPNFTRPTTSSGLPSPMMQSGNPLLSKPKVDPYYLITNNLLNQLRVDVEVHISFENPFRWDGTGTSWNYDEILRAFAKGHVVQIGMTDMRLATPFFGISVGGVASPSLDGIRGAPETRLPSGPWIIKLTKVAVLSRKDELLEGGKKPINRKWRPCSVALTRSQLLVFRDLSWSSTLLSWDSHPRKPPIPASSFKPDEVIPLKDALAVLDRSYSKHLNTFRLTTRDGRHILFQTTEEKEMNEWISRINYASTFKTSGIHMRSLGMTDKVIELTGVAAASSHLHDLQLSNTGQPRVLTWDHRSSEPADELPDDVRLRGEHFAATSGHQSGILDLSAPEVEGASQFKETFDTVKAELASTRNSFGELPDMEDTSSAVTNPPRLASRSHMIHTRVQDLENQICAANAQIDSSMHITRNIAILTPFQKSTRDRLQDIVQTLSKKIQAMRLEVTKLICHRNILLNDLAVEQRNFKQATSLALQAATESLQQHYSEPTSQPSSSAPTPPPTSPSREQSSASSQSFDSSTTLENFHSALDFGPDWPSGEIFASSSFFGPSLSIDSPVTPRRDNSIGYPPPDETSYLSLSPTNQSPSKASLHDDPSAIPDFPEEQAEEWNKTRAAKRVSLVKLPPDLRMTAIASKSSRLPKDDDMLKEEPIVIENVAYRT